MVARCRYRKDVHIGLFFRMLRKLHNDISRNGIGSWIRMENLTNDRSGGYSLIMKVKMNLSTSNIANCLLVQSSSKCSHWGSDIFVIFYLRKKREAIFLSPFQIPHFPLRFLNDVKICFPIYIFCAPKTFFIPLFWFLINRNDLKVKSHFEITDCFLKKPSTLVVIQDVELYSNFCSSKAIVK